MKFLFWKKEENKPPIQRRSLNDIFLTNKKKFSLLPKRYLVIRIDPSFLKDFFAAHHRLMSLVGVLLIVAILGSVSPFARASIAKFYPTTCLGGWEHPENVKGEPSLSADALATDFNLSNSAHMQSSSSSLYCGGFKGEIPDNTKPTRFRVSLLLSVDDGSVVHQETSPLDNLLSLPSNIPADNFITTPTIDTPVPSTETPSVPTESTPSPSGDQPQSFLNNLFVSTAFAEGNPDLPISDNTQSSAQDTTVLPPITLSDQFLEVDYTLDGTTWNILGNLTRSSWQNNSFDIPLTKWTNLDNLQIAVKDLPTFDDPSVVYLDSIAVSVDYDNIENLIKPPTVILKDSASVISSEKTDFSSNEQPTFTVTNPNIDTNGIKTLIDENKAEVVSDPNGALGKPNVPPSEPQPPTSAPEPIDAPVSVHYVPKLITEFYSLFNPKTETAHAADFSSEEKAISASVLDAEGNLTQIPVTVSTVLSEGIPQQQIKIDKPKREFRPGRYTLKISMATSQATIISTQDFTWGVLAINMNKSVYEAGADAYIQMGVLNDEGRTLCNAELELSITGPDGSQNNFSTKNKSIIAAKECGPDNIIAVPDYYTHFKIPSDSGAYHLTLTANTKNGTKSITDSFEVLEQTPFIVERTGPTRINPKSDYPMILRVVAQADWQGTITEKVPTDFEVLEPDIVTTYDKVETSNNTKIISWNVALSAGQEKTLGYNFKAPDVSPQFYLLGEAELKGSSNNSSFTELRNWQIASDATCTLTNAAGSYTWDGVANVAQAGHGTATWTGCNGGVGFTPATGDTIQINSGLVLSVTGNASIAALTMNTPTVANGFTVNNGVLVTVSGALTFNTNATAVNSLVTLGSGAGSGNLTVGSISMAVPTGGVASIEKINCSASGTGTLTVSTTGTIAITGSSTASNSGSASIDMSAGACNVITGTGTNTLTAGTIGATPNAFIQMGTGTITFNNSLTFAGATANKDRLITANGTTISL
ncbi:MAG TPA: hypothetical protein VGO21_04465, partial [Candidatus Paceibacterota bacterium]|nr:hypothetical protein [Candidatus Paceibacterota bacterium]